MSNATTVLLVRHAAIECARNGQALLCGSYDVPLNEAGKLQVERLRLRLARERIDALYTSPLRRAVETAHAAPEALLSQMQIAPSLAEIHCGEFEGFPIAAVKKLYPQLWLANEVQNDEHFCWPGGETYAQFRGRVLQMMNTIVRDHRGRRVLVFTHAGVINQILGSITGQSAARWENPRPHNASITSVGCDDDRWTIERFDDRDHL